MPGRRKGVDVNSDQRVRANVEHTSSITSIKVCASSPRKRRVVSPPPAKTASIREGNSCGANSRPINRLQAKVLELRKRIDQGGAKLVPLSDSEVVASIRASARHVIDDGMRTDPPAITLVLWNSKLQNSDVHTGYCTSEIILRSTEQPGKPLTGH